MSLTNLSPLGVIIFLMIIMVGIAAVSIYYRHKYETAWLKIVRMAEGRENIYCKRPLYLSQKSLIAKHLNSLYTKEYHE